MIDWLQQIDEQLLLAINGAWPSGDNIMWWVSKPLVWTPLYLLLIISLLKRYKSRNVRGLIFASIILSVAITDLVSARVLKPGVARLRPSHQIELVDSLDLYERSDGTLYKGGKFGFVSSHAANHMSIAILIGLLLSRGKGGFVQNRKGFVQNRKEKKWLISLSVWAIIIGYSRVHLGVHFPGDVISGWALGALVGVTIFRAINPKL